MADTTLLELGVVEVKPKYIVACLPELEHARKIYEKHGAKYHGVWIGEAGAACTIFSLVEWPSFDKRAQLREEVMKDPDWLAYHERIARYLLRAENYLGKSETPIKPFLGNQPIWLDKIRPVNIEAYAVNKLLELTSFYDKMMDQDCGLNAVLNPFCYPQHVIWSIWEMKPGHKLDRITTSFLTAKKDSSNYQKLEESRGYLEVVGSVLATPVDFSKLPKKA